MRLLLAFVFTLGCSSSSSSGLDRSAFDLDVCKSGRWDVLAGVVARDGAYLELDISASGTMRFTREVMSRSGTPCVGVADPTGCTEALAKVSSTVGFATETCGGAGCTRYLRWFTREKAGVITVLTRIEDLIPLIAPIDSPAKAALVAAYRFAVDDIECSGPQVKRLEDGSYDVYLAHGDADCTPRVEKRVRVRSDGNATVVETATTPEKRTCISA